MAYEDLTVEELQDRLRKMDQPVSGNKDELIERLQAAEGAMGPQAMEPQGSVVPRGGDDEGEGGHAYDYGPEPLDESEASGGHSFDYGEESSEEG